MLTFIGGVPRQIVSDNLRAGITRACFYEPLVNRTYADMASYYGTAVVPARPYKPRDKAKVEVGVQVVQRWILARLRNQRFFSLVERTNPGGTPLRTRPRPPRRPAAKLSPQQQAEVLAMLSTGRSAADVARLFRVHRATISRVVSSARL